MTQEAYPAKVEVSAIVLGGKTCFSGKLRHLGNRNRNHRGHEWNELKHIIMTLYTNKIHKQFCVLT